MAESNYIFYQIKWHGQSYVGELNSHTSSKNFWTYHIWDATMKKFLIPMTSATFTDTDSTQDPNTDGESDATRWERKYAKELGTLGFNQTQKDFQGYYAPSTTVIQTLKNELDQAVMRMSDETCPYDKSKYNMGKCYEDLFQIYKGAYREKGVPPEIAFPEMLLICLAAYKEGRVLNTHANYGTRFGTPFTKANITEVWNVDTMQAREQQAITLMPSLWYTFKLDNLPEEIAKAMNRIGHIHASGKTVAVNIRSHKKLIQAVKHKVQQSTLDSLSRQLKNYVKQIEGRPGAEPVIQQINNILNNITADKQGRHLNNMIGKQLSTLNHYLDDCMNKIHTGSIQVSNDVFKQQTIRLLYDWAEHSNLTNFFSNEYGIDKITQSYKTKLTNWIQKYVIKAAIDQDQIAAFHAWQLEKYAMSTNPNAFKDHGGHNYQWFYMNYAKEQLNIDQNEIQSFKAKTLGLLASQYPGLQFLQSNWTNIYREQIAIYLNTEKDKTEISNYPNFSHRFVQFNTAAQITIY